MHWILYAKSNNSCNTDLIGIYKTRKAANFISKKVRNQRGNSRLLMELTDKSLFPKTSFKVDEYLDNSKPLNKESNTWLQQHQKSQ